ncbi:MAG TPA: hypothetical protein VNS49_01915 [Streptomyces sp.]|nr:hypothetical protein [Streptomyces sp.]
MNTAIGTVVGIALLALITLPPVIGALRERGIDRQLRGAGVPPPPHRRSDHHRLP